MKRFLGIALVCLILVGFISQPQISHAQEEVASIDQGAAGEEVFISPSDIPPDEFSRAVVEEIVWEGTQGDGLITAPLQLIRIKFLGGSNQGETVEFRHGEFVGIDETQKVKVGEQVVIGKSYTVQGVKYYVADKYRLPALGWILLLFFAMTAWLGRWRGVMSVVGLAISIAVLSMLIVPGIMAGYNPLLVSFGGSLIIVSTSLFLAHGFTFRTFLAFLATLTTLVIATLMAVIFVNGARLFGLGSEGAFLLTASPLGAINLQGLLLGGIIIGTLGVLDDITTAQVAVVDEVRLANPKLTFAELYRSGIAVGREHIASLVNTLVLAYAGASLPVFLLFSTYNQNTPLWLTMNSESVAEEVVRTLVGSMALILAVPIATGLAAYYLPRRRGESSGKQGHSHRH